MLRQAFAVILECCTIYDVVVSMYIEFHDDGISIFDDGGLKY